ncbi:hypothetical protein [Agrobacterium rosae]
MPDMTALSARFISLCCQKHTFGSANWGKSLQNIKKCLLNPLLKAEWMKLPTQPPVHQTAETPHSLAFGLCRSARFIAAADLDLGDNSHAAHPFARESSSLNSSSFESKSSPFSSMKRSIRGKHSNEGVFFVSL